MVGVCTCNLSREVLLSIYYWPLWSDIYVNNPCLNKVTWWTKNIIILIEFHIFLECDKDYALITYLSVVNCSEIVLVFFCVFLRKNTELLIPSHSHVRDRQYLLVCWLTLWTYPCVLMFLDMGMITLALRHPLIPYPMVWYSMYIGYHLIVIQIFL